MFCVRGYTLDVVCVVCLCSSHTVIYIQPSWQSCTGDAAPRVVNMHGVRVVYMYEEGADHSLPSPWSPSTPRRPSCWKPLPQWSGVSHPSWQGDLPPIQRWKVSQRCRLYHPSQVLGPRAVEEPILLAPALVPSPSPLPLVAT